MPAQAKAEAGIVGDEVLAFGERKEVGLGCCHVGHRKRAGTLDACDVPVSLPAMAGQSGECAGGGEAFQVARVDAAAREVFDAAERASRTRSGKAGDAFQRQSLHLTEAQAQSRLAALASYHGAIPLAC